MHLARTDIDLKQGERLVGLPQAGEVVRGVGLPSRLPPVARTGDRRSGKASCSARVAHALMVAMLPVARLLMHRSDGNEKIGYKLNTRMR